MDRIARTQWVEASQAFFDAYIQFRIEGKETHYFVLNEWGIEISFTDHGDYLAVKLSCPNMRKVLSGYFDHSPKHTEDTIGKIQWLAWGAEDGNIYDLTNAANEYQLLRDTLVLRYRLCFAATWEDDFWKDIGEEEFDILLHDRQIHVHFAPDDSWETNGYIAVSLFCYETGRTYFTVVDQKEENPKELIRLIQDIASEPDIIEFSAINSEWEHELIRNSLVRRRTEDGKIIKCYPFCWVYSWDRADIKEQLIELHNRQIRIQFEAQGDTLQITLYCKETGKSCTLGLPKQCRNVEEIGEEFVWKIQELAWEEA